MPVNPDSVGTHGYTDSPALPRPPDFFKFRGFSFRDFFFGRLPEFKVNNFFAVRSRFEKKSDQGQTCGAESLKPKKDFLEPRS